MDMVRPDAIAQAVKPAAGEAAEAAKGGKGFEQVMSDAEQGRIKLGPPETHKPPVHDNDSLKAQKLTEEKTRIAQSPGGIEKLGLEIEKGGVRLRELVDKLQGGASFTPQQLIGIQAEMHEITLQIEVSTKVVAETVSGVKNLLQQQA